MHQHIN